MSTTSAGSGSAVVTAFLYHMRRILAAQPCSGARWPAGCPGQRLSRSAGGRLPDVDAPLPQFGFDPVHVRLVEALGAGAARRGDP